QLPRRLADVRDHMLERELRRVDADDLEAVLVVRGVPRIQVRQRAEAVDARVGPEVDEDNLAAELLRRQRLRVDPGGDPGEVRRLPEVLERRSRRGDTTLVEVAPHIAGP